MFQKTILAALVCLAPTLAWAFDLQGHRGARGLMPENTLPAFAKALSIGVTTLELDTGVTKDDVVVVSHNPGLDPNITRDGQGQWVTTKPLLKDMAFQDLQKFDVGRINPDSPTAKRFPNQIAVDGTRIPSLEQVFQLVRNSKNKTVRFNIETKLNPLKPDDTLDPNAFAKAVLAVISKYAMEDRSSIQSFDWRTLQAVQKMNPNIETVYLSAQQNWLDNVKPEGAAPSNWTAGFNLNDHGGSVAKMIKAAGGKVWSPFARDLTKAKVQQAQGLGLKVVPWTVNKKNDMIALIEMGVDGIISDYPDVLRDAMNEAGLALPQATPVSP